MTIIPRQEALAPHLAITLPRLDEIDWRTHTLVDLLRLRAETDPGAVLYTYLVDGETQEASLTARTLANMAFALGRTLTKFAKPGARVVLLYDDGLDTISGLFGCLSAGLVAVSGIHPSAPRSAERLAGILKDSGATVVLGHARVLTEFQRALDDVLDDFDLRWVAVDGIKPGAADGWAGVSALNGDLAFIQYTSGSSREPKGVTLSHRNALHNLASQAEIFGYRPGSTGVSWLPFSHDMGLIGCVLMAAYAGGRCILLSPSHFIEDPLRWLRAVSRYQAMASAAPNFAYELCAGRATEADLRDLDLSSWQIAVNGAEPIRAGVLRHFATVFAPAGFRAQALQPSYGLAEATLLVSTGPRLVAPRIVSVDKARLRQDEVLRLAEGDTQGIELVSCGHGLPGQHLAIVDPKTLGRATSGQVGEIWVAGPSVSAGYFGRSAENAAHFAGDLGDGHGPYLRTGDLGFMIEDELFVTGRLRDLLVIRGKNHYPQDLEHSAEASHPAIRQGNIACFLMEETGELAIVCEILRAHHDAAAEVATAIRQAIVRDHGVEPARVVIAASGSVLKTPSGKIQRARNAADYAEGRMTIVHEALSRPAPSVEPAAPIGAEPFTVSRVEAWFRARLERMGVPAAHFDPSTRLTDLGFDSLKIVELKAALHKDFGITVAIADLYQMQDIRALTSHLVTEARRAEGRRASVETIAGSPVPAVSAAPAPPRASNRLAEQRQRRGQPAKSNANSSR